MKKAIATAIIALSAVSAYAQPFDFERQIGTVELFPTLAGDGAVAASGGSRSSVFAHERAIGAVALYPTLLSEQAEYNPTAKSDISEPFNYRANVWHTDGEIGG